MNELGKWFYDMLYKLMVIIKRPRRSTLPKVSVSMAKTKHRKPTSAGAPNWSITDTSGGSNDRGSSMPPKQGRIAAPPHKTTSMDAQQFHASGPLKMDSVDSAPSMKSLEQHQQIIDKDKLSVMGWSTGDLTNATNANADIELGGGDLRQRDTTGDEEEQVDTSKAKIPVWLALGFTILWVSRLRF